MKDPYTKYGDTPPKGVSNEVFWRVWDALPRPVRDALNYVPHGHAFVAGWEAVMARLGIDRQGNIDRG